MVGHLRSVYKYNLTEGTSIGYKIGIQAVATGAACSEQLNSDVSK